MMMRNVFTFLVLAAALGPTATVAATFSVLCDNSGEQIRRGCTVKLAGRIEAGDAARLRAVVKQELLDGWHYRDLLLDSPGGDVKAAIELADVVRQALLDTTTHRLAKDYRSAKESMLAKFKCVSACFLVWVAGAERSAFMNDSQSNARAEIGLHRPYFDKATYAQSPERVAAMQQEAMKATQDYLQRELGQL